MLGAQTIDKLYTGCYIDLMLDESIILLIKLLFFWNEKQFSYNHLVDIVLTVIIYDNVYLKHESYLKYDFVRAYVHIVIFQLL